MTKADKAKKIERAMEIIIDSLQSHLPYTHSGELIRGEDDAFHKTCVKEYCEVLKILSELY